MGTEHEKASQRQNIKLTVTKLQTYYSDDVVKKHNGAPTVL